MGISYLTGPYAQGSLSFAGTTAKQLRADRAQYGGARASVGFIAAVLTCKHNPHGDPRNIGKLLGNMGCPSTELISQSLDIDIRSFFILRLSY